MRTVTFSQQAVAKLVNDRFIATWVNRDSKFHNCDFTQERWIQTYAKESFATGNFCTFFATPDRRILHYVSGYVAPPLFEREARFALDLSESAFDKGLKARSKTAADYARAHSQRAVLRDEHSRRVAAAEPFTGWDGEKLGAGASESASPDALHVRRGNVVENLRHLATVHRQLEGMARNGRLPALDALFRSYNVGNTFTEGADPAAAGKPAAKDDPADPGVGKSDNDAAKGGALNRNKDMKCKGGGKNPGPAEEPDPAPDPESGKPPSKPPTDGPGSGVGAK